ncbi:MAG: phosphatidylglycerophosphatase A [Proteobacteria bacterium]|nr:phosphatidylglycerophosphatase A [Pseudomonadota bacterium]
MTAPTLTMLRDPGHFLALGGGSGLVPKGPGTAGTVVGLLVYWPMMSLDHLSYLAISIVLFGIGVPLCQRTAAILGEHDHPAIVWDEIVGILLTLSFISPSITGCVLAFVLFRIFDIFKPWPISFLDRRIGGGLGIMLDDLFAAIYSVIALAFIEYLSYI